jgi:hypothetical protein
MRRASRLTILALIAACGRDAPVLLVGELELAGPTRSGQASLYALADGRVALTWLEPTPSGAHALRLAVRTGDAWGEPLTVASGNDFFVNWADFPSFVEMADGTWAVHWLERAGAATYAYHVRIALSSDGGRTWSEPITPHRDASPSEHGFVSMAPWGEDAAALLWLDGREMQDTDGDGLLAGDMSLRFTTLTSDGRLGEDVRVDVRTCECCQTALARTSSGLVAAYRDRSADELRDVAIVRYRDGAWSVPEPVADDGFVYPGCPVNGPQLAARGDTVVVAWYTAPGGEARVQAAFSVDGGESWTAPIRVDLGDPLGRVDVALVDGENAIVLWLERTPEAANVLAGRVRRDGGRSTPVLVAPTVESRAGGVPRLALTGDALAVVWREVGETERIRVRSLHRAP